MFKYKIDARDLEKIEDTETQSIDNDDSAFIGFMGELEQNNLLFRDKNGVIANKDGCYYFNNIEELVFKNATDESKKNLRKAIKDKMITANQKID